MVGMACDSKYCAIYFVDFVCVSSNDFGRNVNRKIVEKIETAHFSMERWAVFFY